MQTSDSWMGFVLAERMRMFALAQAALTWLYVSMDYSLFGVKIVQSVEYPLKNGDDLPFLERPFVTLLPFREEGVQVTSGAVLENNEDMVRGLMVPAEPDNVGTVDSLNDLTLLSDQSLVSDVGLTRPLQVALDRDHLF